MNGIAASATERRPHLAWEELQQLKWLLGGGLTVLGAATAAYIDIDAWALMALTIAASLLTTLRPDLPARIPRLVHVLAFPAIAAFFALDLWLRSELLPAMIRLDLLLLLYRAIVYRQRRDDLQVIVLGLFLVVVAGVLTVSLVFAAQLLAYAACALVFLLVITLVDTSAPAAASSPTATVGQPGQPPPWVSHVNWTRLLRRIAAVADWRVIALGAGLFVGLIGVTALLFLVFPRFQLDNGMFLDRFITRQARTGFSETIRFGDVTSIQEDTSVALHVDVSDPGQIPETPYWRMLVLDQYDDGTFQMSAGLRRALFRDRGTGVVVDRGRLASRTSRSVWTFYLESGVSRFLPLLNSFQRLRFSESQNYQVAFDSAMVALNKDPVTITAYRVEGFDLATRLNDSPGRLYTGLIPAREPNAVQDNAKLLALAAEAAGSGPEDTAAFASRVCAWLRDRHPYSLSPRIPPGAGDPLVRWVGSRDAGHCELFAGSFVLLARAAGFPARVVTGFRGGSWNGFASSFMVRNSNAHAWAEIYDRSTRSWLRADPLEIPGASETGAASAGGSVQRTDRSWSARLDSLRVFWYRRVVNFDEQTQARTFQAVKDAAQSIGVRFRAQIDSLAAALKRWWSTPWDAGRVASLVALTLVAAALTWVWRRVRLVLLQHSFWRRRARRDDPIRREASRWLHRVAEGAPAGPARDSIVAELQRLRFGARGTWPEAIPVFRRARSMVRRHV
ncbi:MAG TPA: DUF3488 and transglutaminase-like domain-containing protein [Opitutaceae bacterium]|nr:DUF3488 and transglutaminase-like domain-containing protein [Opitutaceae bacterium]